MSTVARLCTEPALRRVDDFSGCASLAAFTDKIPREGDRMGPNGCLMPKRPKFSPFLTHCNCEPYKHAVIFLKKSFFVVHFAFWVLIRSRERHHAAGAAGRGDLEKEQHRKVTNHVQHRIPHQKRRTVRAARGHHVEP